MPTKLEVALAAMQMAYAHGADTSESEAHAQKMTKNWPILADRTPAARRGGTLAAEHGGEIGGGIEPHDQTPKAQNHHYDRV